MIGIYKITNLDGKIYVGQSKDIESRFKAHKKITAGTNGKLKKSFLKYGVESHIFEVIEECLIEDLNIRESYWQRFFNCIEDGLNTTPTKSKPRRERRLSYGEEAVLVSLRVPESKKNEILDRFYALLKQYYVGNAMNPINSNIDVKKKSDPTDEVFYDAPRNKNLTNDEPSQFVKPTIKIDEVYDCVVVTKGVPDVAYRKNISYKSDLAFLDVHDSDVYYGFVNGVYYKFIDKKEFDRFCGDYLIK